MARSLDAGGVRVDLGSHRLHPSTTPRVRTLLDELLGDDLQVRERNGLLHAADRWLGFPFRAGELLRSLPRRVAARAAVDALSAPLRRPRSDTYAEVVRAGLGPTALALFHGPMAHKLWGLSPDELSGELARRRISVRTPAALVQRVVRTSRPAGRTFLYPRLGYGQVVERLAEAAAAAGVDVRCGERVARLRPATEGASVSVDTGTSGGIETARVMWAAPLEALAGSTHDADGACAPRQSTGALHRAMVLVYLVLDEARYAPIDAHYVPDGDVAFSRLSEPKNYREGPDPPDRTVLCAELPCWVDDDVWIGDEQQLADLVLDGMDRCGLRDPSVAEVVVERLPHVYPVLRAGTADERAALLAWADRVPGVAVLGRQGRLVADNLHHVLDMGLSAAACLGPDGTWDESAWTAHRARFEGFVVDD
jgi:protoporphyrinogen oxidase